ncbi:hypothetical protein G8A07_11515 [Roseateles sp. DAIF2]|uniref:ATP-binding protein n=1 Tax=Roseateles sp. DAIF2 TaxID=2714952 RepID=UPI0018A28D55|nr:ATP-binding protein [Roseateles sp. DAIF2]QPF73484.1 hypothetical protein G8A07_11515 [Roseateles sp. DAIF2]
MGLSSAHAIGVGRPQTLSALGQPLSLVFPVQLASGERLGPECVRAEVLAGDSRLPPTLVQLQLEGEGETHVRAVRVQSLVQVDEPLVTVSLSLGCPVRLVRQFTAFIDPPNHAVQTAPPVAEAPRVQQYSPALQAALSTADAKPNALLSARAASAPEVAALMPATVAAAEPPARPRPPRAERKKAVAPAAEASGDKTSSQQAAAKPAKKSAQVSETAAKPAATKTAEKPRLQMDPPEVLVEAAAPASAPSAASSAPEDESRQRLAKLEQSLKDMQAQQRGADERLAALQARLAQAESARYANPLVYGLGLLTLALGGACLWLWRGRQADRRMHESAWWDDVKTARRESQLSQLDSLQAEAVVARSPAPLPPEPPAAPARPLEPEPIPEPAVWARPDEQTLPVPALAEPVLSVATAPVELEPLSFQLADAPAAPPSAAVPAVTVETLIDLEQQVDFFQVLGQDEAAIELLRAHLGNGASLPYLQLLEIHRRRGEQPAFEALAADYAQHFGAAAPEGDAAAGLEDQAAVLGKLQGRWRDPAASMAMLQSLLTGPAGMGLGLAVCRDLLLLYSVARDLSEQEVRGSEIDLFLPLDTPAAGMMATMVWQAPAGAAVARSHAIEVDISLDEVGAEAADAAPPLKGG